MKDEGKSVKYFMSTLMVTVAYFEMEIREITASRKIYSYTRHDPK